MADFLETPAFPSCPAYGYVTEPMYSTNVVQVASGREKRNRNWARPLCRYTFTVARQQAEIEDILEFFHAVGGRDCGFRFKDHLDFKSCRATETPTATDQPLAILADASEGYQLTKQYAVGARTQTRDIVKPIAGTIIVANESGVAQPSSRWDLDEATGILIPNGTFSGTPTYWGGEFDVPVRFDSDTLPFEIISFRVESVQFSLTEMRL